MPDVVDPSSGSSVNLVGLQAHNPSKPKSGWYLVRDASAHYTLREVPDLTGQASRGLVAVRAIHVSPFPEDHGEALYMGGFDADFQPAHDSAWLYRVGVRTALGLRGSP
jgi:hypothetical protein